MKKLVIVESPSKSKTIEKYLGTDYKVLSSKGHIRDLATTGKYGFGVDLEDNFKPNYVIMKEKKKTVTELKKAIKDSDLVVLATDPDREGEAISWHLKCALDLDDNEYERVVFNEITESTIKEAFNNPRKIDEDLVHSQESRRILDRIIGFRLSKLIQRKTAGKSAGRVQSVALKLIVDREKEIEAFIPKEYYTILAHFNEFDAELEKYKGKKLEINSEKEADDILSSLGKDFKIESVTKKERKKSSKPVFTTSTLTQLASTKLGFSASKTMRTAQKLYEGIELENGPVGIITYMRTDSTRLSDSFVSDAKDFISKKYGKEYLGNVKITKKKDNVQDAHEGIRPTSVHRTPESIKSYLTPDEYKLYKLIYVRALSSLLADARYDATSVELLNNDYMFKATGSVLTFDGYLKLYSDYEQNEDKILPDFSSYNSGVILANDIEKLQHFTEAPARYTEAKLIEKLESLGIGRPSTYATIIETLKARKYVEIKEKKFYPTKVGIVTTDKLQEFFSNIINVEYTANMESDLDKIASGETIWYEILDNFYKEFEPMVDVALKEMEKEAPETTGETCPDCGSDLVVRHGRYGAFVACSNYPECKYIKKEENTVVEICDCPKCGGKIIERKSKRGKVFYGCNNYPKCKNAFWDKPTGEVCPTCGEMLIEKSGKIKCSACEYEK